jgi:hypothetical protein
MAGYVEIAVGSPFSPELPTCSDPARAWPRSHLDIDIKDLQKVFGRDGSTCQQPLPPQPPAPPPAPFG